jgi:hypothetical protein
MVVCKECNFKEIADMCMNRITVKVKGTEKGNCILDLRANCGDLVLGCKEFKCRMTGACERAYRIGLADAERKAEDFINEEE